MDSDGVNMADAQVRDVTGGCVYVDNVDGWEFYPDVKAEKFITPGDGSYLEKVK